MYSVGNKTESEVPGKLIKKSTMLFVVYMESRLHHRGLALLFWVAVASAATPVGAHFPCCQWVVAKLFGSPPPLSLPHLPSFCSAFYYGMITTGSPPQVWVPWAWTLQPQRWLRNTSLSLVNYQASRTLLQWHRDEGRIQWVSQNE